MKSPLSLVLKFLFAAAVLAPVAHAVPGVPGPAPKEAFLIPVKGNWQISGALPENALLIGLQNPRNRRGASHVELAGSNGDPDRGCQPSDQSGRCIELEDRPAVHDRHAIA